MLPPAPCGTSQLCLVEPMALVFPTPCFIHLSSSVLQIYYFCTASLLSIQLSTFQILQCFLLRIWLWKFKKRKEYILILLCTYYLNKKDIRSIFRHFRNICSVKNSIFRVMVERTLALLILQAGGACTSVVVAAGSLTFPLVHDVSTDKTSHIGLSPYLPHSPLFFL